MKKEEEIFKLLWGNPFFSCLRNSWNRYQIEVAKYFILYSSRVKQWKQVKTRISQHNEAVLQFRGAGHILGDHPGAKLWSDFIELPARHLSPVLNLPRPVHDQGLDDHEVDHTKHMSCLLKYACVLEPVG